MLAVTGGPAQAGPLLITPTTVELAAGRRSAAIEVVNQSDQPADLQFRAFAWSQDRAGDHLEQTAALAISPSIATLPAHGRQVFRIFALDAAPAIDERSYRLKLNELPGTAGPAVTINVEFSLPVFVTPRDATAALDWTPAPGTTPAIDVVNRGHRRVRLATLALATPDGSRRAVTLPGTTYILAGATRRFAVAAPVRPADGLRLVGSGDTGSIDVAASVPAGR